MTINDVARYYDTHQIYYSLFWSRDALHYGLWYESTRTLREAIHNTNVLICAALQIDHSDRVLDAGCGVGGTATFIAEATGACVEGVTVSPVQQRLAAQRFRRSLASDRLRVTVQDFTHTSFAAAYFDKIFALESLCHCDSKDAFLVEAHRLLRDAGRLVIIDAFRVDRVLEAAEVDIYRRALRGWVIPDLPTISEFQASLGRCGFSDVKYVDLQHNIRRSIARIFRWSLVSRPLALVRSVLFRRPMNESARYQKALFERGLATYGMFIATKADHEA